MTPSEEWVTSFSRLKGEGAQEALLRTSRSRFQATGWRQQRSTWVIQERFARDLYYVILYIAILYYIMSYHIILHYIILYYITLYYITYGYYIGAEIGRSKQVILLIVVLSRR